MKKLKVVFLIIGLSMPVMSFGADKTMGENAEDKVKCEDIFAGTGDKTIVQDETEVKDKTGAEQNK